MTDTTTPTLLTKVQALILPDTETMNRSAKSALRMAMSFFITCDEDEEMAGEELMAVKSKINALEAKRISIAGPLHKAWTDFNQMFKAPMDELKNAEEKLKNSIIAYRSEKERLAVIARQKAEKEAAAARKKIEDEARRIEQEAEAERQRLAKIEAERAAAAQAEQDRLTAAASEAIAAGNTAAAVEAERLANEAFERDQLATQQAREQEEQVCAAAANDVACLKLTAAVTSAPVLHFSKPKAPGISTVRTVDFEVINLHELVKHVAENPDLINLFLTDSTRLRAYVRGLGMNTNLPGVRVFEKKSLSARAA